MKNLVRSDSGASVVEFAIMVPVLAYLLVGLVEIGRYTSFAIMAANAARAGVQYGAQNLTTASDTVGMRTAALKDAQNLTSFKTPTAQHFCSVNGGALSTCATAPPLAPKTVYYVSVSVSGTFNSLLNYPGIPKSIPVTGSAVMRVADQ